MRLRACSNPEKWLARLVAPNYCYLSSGGRLLQGSFHCMQCRVCFSENSRKKELNLPKHVTIKESDWLLWVVTVVIEEFNSVGKEFNSTHWSCRLCIAHLVFAETSEAPNQLTGIMVRDRGPALQYVVVFPAGSTFTASATPHVPHHAKAPTPESAAGSPMQRHQEAICNERRDGITHVQSRLNVYNSIYPLQ